MYASSSPELWKVTGGPHVASCGQHFGRAAAEAEEEEEEAAAQIAPTERLAGAQKASGPVSPSHAVAMAGIAAVASASADDHSICTSRDPKTGSLSL